MYKSRSMFAAKDRTTGYVCNITFLCGFRCYLCTRWLCSVIHI